MADFDREANGVGRVLLSMTNDEVMMADVLLEPLKVVASRRPRVTMLVSIQTILVSASECGVAIDDLCAFIKDGYENAIAPVERAQRDGLS